MALIYSTVHEQFYVLRSSQCEVIEYGQRDHITLITAVRNDKFKGIKFISISNNEKPQAELEIELDIDSDPVKVVKADQNNLIVCTKSGRMFMVNEFQKDCSA